MVKNKAGWVALIVLAIASLLMIFFVMPNIQTAPETPVAEVPPKAETPPAVAPAAPAISDAKTARPSAPADTSPADPTSARTAPATPAPADSTAPAADGAPMAAAPDGPVVAVPNFDVLRVEPDGSTVIAGRAQPDATIEIVNDNAVVATAKADAIGDFVAVFDAPLPPGDYQLSLRGIGKDGTVTLSKESATVSVPKDSSGELLAMVTKPGEASRIMEAPVASPAPAAPAAPGQTTAAPAAAVAAKPAALSVSAVEIEGRKIFVAGNAVPGATVRIYADGTRVGEAKADEHGRFVVDGVIDLSVGQHTIRADQIGADGKMVELRASVPFDRPAGDQIAAVAEAGAAGVVASFDGGSFDALRLEATKALGLLKGLFAKDATPGAEQLAAARSATEIALNSIAEFKVADTLDAGLKEMVDKATGAAASALKLLKSLPQDAASVRAALPQIEAAVGSALMPRTDGAGASATAAPAAPATAPVADAAPAVPAAPAAPSIASPEAAPAAEDGPQLVQQAPLKQSTSSVIIRRGDTLWQISRRVYGAGVRYTTIYVANEDQISDPNRILPGQVFGVPDRAMPDAESEQIHRKHLPRAP